MRPPAPLLVLGLGNVLCGDDGLGAAAVALLASEYEIPEEVRVLDGGTLGLSLLPELTDAAQAILVDAVRTDAPAGSLVRFEGDEVAPVVQEKLSPHQIGVADLLQGARLLGRCPSPLVLLGLVPQTIELGVGRSDAVDRQLPALVARVAREAARLGHPLKRRASDEAAVALSSRDVGGVLGL